MLSLALFDLANLRQVYEWDRAQQIEPFETYAARLSNADTWLHYAILDGERLAGCVSLELVAPTECSIHLAKPPGGDRAALRRLLIGLGILLFENNFTRLICQVRPDNAAAEALVRACGMTEVSRDANYITLALTADEFFANPTAWD